VLWFGTYDGVSRYDGKEFVNLKPRDGLEIAAVYVAPSGTLWFGSETDGLYRYDGTTFASLTLSNGLADDPVHAIHYGSDGRLWFGTFGGFGGGVAVYDGKEFVNLTAENGLAGNLVGSIHRDSNGIMWIGTHSGLSRYDGVKFENFTTKDGLVHNKVTALYSTPDGLIWLGTFGGGVAIYDGTAWTSLDTRDGLANNVVQGICSDADGNLWFATQGGITRYRRSATPPKAHIVSVTTDRTYTDLDAVPAFSVGTRITIEYGSIDYRTIPEKRQYRCRIREVDEDWRNPTKSDSFDYVFDEPGTYTFEVQAINRDLNYSEPAMVSLNIQSDPKLDSMQTELSYLRGEVGRKYQFESIVGSSAAIMQVRGLMEKAIESRLAVLITGETGTGKELVAKAIHHNSPRKGHPLLALNCGAIPRELLASELFGHCRGAFTGARKDKIGLFEAASGGTLILDEISEMPEDAQVHLLRVLEERMVQRLGEHISRNVDVRVIAITNQDLMKEVSEGRFREDLYYRLSVFPIYIPPLRELSQDVPPLAEHFLQDVEKELNGFAPDVFGMLQSYSWPGNVRELRNAVHRAAALAESEIQTYHFPPEITRGESLIQDAIGAGSGYSEIVKSLQRRLIEQVLRECEGNRHEAARRLKMNRSNLLRLMKRFGIS
jgi:DNA-binding NtrC family response regulator